MSLYRRFPAKSYEEVSRILTNSGHGGILNHIRKTERGYILHKPIEQVSPLPTYQFAIACALASLGNIELAEDIYPNGERIIEPQWGDNISRNLAYEFLG